MTTLYWTLMSQPSRAVKCLLELGKVEHSLQEIDLMGNQTRSKEYLNINPLGQIPFLTDGAFKLAESSAILVYLCEKHPQLAQYYGNSKEERGRVNQFLSAYQSVYRPALFKIIFLKVYKGLKRKRAIKESELQLAQKEMLRVVGEVEGQLKHSKTRFLAGNTLTIADLLYFFETTNFLLYELTLDQFPLLKGWFQRVLEVPEVRQLTEQWQGLVPGMVSMFKQLPVVPASKL